jgi:hypothetical protein
MKSNFFFSGLTVCVLSSVAFLQVQAGLRARPIGHLPGHADHLPGLADTLPGSAITIYGRGLAAGGRAELIGSASHAGFSFSGKQCEVDVLVPDRNSHNYLQYELDGVYQKKVRVGGGKRQTLVIAALTGGSHRVWLYKGTEAMSGPIFIEKISGDGLKPLKNKSAALIEFIGNSITCGAASDTTEFPCQLGEYVDHHNAYYAYGPRTARSLGVEYRLSSVSGIGIYRNWNSDGPTMPQVYEKASLQVSDSRLWDFSKDLPAIVCIALGTNDFSHGDGKHPRLPFDSAVFTKTYIRFVQLVKSKYPSAKIALLNSPMVHGSDGLLLDHCLSAVKKGIDGLYPAGGRVALFFFPPMQPGGCGGHPSVEDHAILTKQLSPFLKNLLLPVH